MKCRHLANTYSEHLAWPQQYHRPYKLTLIARPGPNVPLNLPIIQELCSLISTPLFKRKSSIILKKKVDKNADDRANMNMTRMYMYKMTER